MKEFVIGDIHGSHLALTQVLARSNFNYSEDKLICLGDVADGWTETSECFEELFKIDNLVYVRGNHDQWLKDWLKSGKKPDVWTMQGGQNTIKSYLRSPHLRKPHLEFLKKTPFYHIDEKNRVFVHGGISQDGIPVEETDKHFLSWDRGLWDNRHNIKKEDNIYNEVYVGHTSIWNLSKVPANYGNVWFMDTGGGWEGRLSIMDINTKEVFQSERVADLYPSDSGRNGGMSKRDRDYFIKLYKEL